MARVAGSTGRGRMIYTTKAMFTMRHYKAIASTMRVKLENADAIECVGIVECLKRLSAMFADDNDRFNEEMFYAACGIPTATVVKTVKPAPTYSFIRS